jgi:RNA polymerase sigma-32 factor
MVQAVKRFDPERGFRLATYAMWWIRASIQEYILRSWSLVKIGTTASQKKLFFNLRRVKGQIKAIEDGDLTPEHVADIARRLNVSETDVVDMNRRMTSPDPSLNVTVRGETDSQWLDWLPSETENQETRLAEDQELGCRRKLLAGAMTVLSERERYILTERRLKEAPSTLEDLSRTYGISRERVRQIEVRAFQKIQQSVREATSGQQLAC